MMATNIDALRGISNAQISPQIDHQNNSPIRNLIYLALYKWCNRFFFNQEQQIQQIQPQPSDQIPQTNQNDAYIQWVIPPLSAM